MRDSIHPPSRKTTGFARGGIRKTCFGPASPKASAEAGEMPLDARGRLSADEPRRSQRQKHFDEGGFIKGPRALTVEFHEKFMYLAIEKARQGIAKGQTPFGACLVKNGKVISCCHNSVWGSLDITAHAEMNVIRQACKKLRTIDLSGCVLYSTCESCPMCFSACHWAKITEIVYGARIEDAKKLGFNELFVSCKKMKRSGKSPIKVRGNFLRRENLELFRLWQKQIHKRVY